MGSTGQAAGRSGALEGISPRAEQLLRALEEIFLTEGFRRVTVGELAARLRCSRRALYELAPSKEQLFLLVLDRFLTRIRRLGAEAVDAASGVREGLVACLAPGVSELRSAGARFLVDVAGFPPARRMLEEHQRQRIDEVRRLVEAGIGEGAFRGMHSQLVAEVILVAVQHVMTPRFLAANNLSASESIGEVEDLILHGLLHPSRRRARRSSRPFEALD